MPNTFQIIITSVGETRFNGAALSANFPTTAGEITILPHHEALVSTLKPGSIKVKVGVDDTRTFEVENGVVECSGNRVVVLL